MNQTGCLLDLDFKTQEPDHTSPSLHKHFLNIYNKKLSSDKIYDAFFDTNYWVNNFLPDLEMTEIQQQDVLCTVVEASLRNNYIGGHEVHFQVKNFLCFNHI